MLAAIAFNASGSKLASASEKVSALGVLVGLLLDDDLMTRAW